MFSDALGNLRLDILRALHVIPSGQGQKQNKFRQIILVYLSILNPVQLSVDSVRYGATARG
jgi:hypothetical protein